MANPPEHQLTIEGAVKCCIFRVSSWRVPPNWNERDWFGEISALGCAAAHEACCVYDVMKGTPVVAFVMSRVMSRLLTRYRQEWSFARRVAEWPMNGTEEVTARAASQIDRHETIYATVRQAVQSLAASDRWILTQLFWHDRLQSEVAGVLGVSQPAISKRRRIILDRLRSLLG